MHAPFATSKSIIFYLLKESSISFAIGPKRKSLESCCRAVNIPPSFPLFSRFHESRSLPSPSSYASSSSSSSSIALRLVSQITNVDGVGVLRSPVFYSFPDCSSESFPSATPGTNPMDLALGKIPLVCICNRTTALKLPSRAAQKFVCISIFCPELKNGPDDGPTVYSDFALMERRPA